MNNAQTAFWTAVLALVTALANSFGPLLAKWLMPKSGVSKRAVERLASESAEAVAASLKRTQEMLAGEMSRMGSGVQSNASKLDVLLDRTGRE